MALPELQDLGRSGMAWSLMPVLLSRTEYARHRKQLGLPGVSRQAVSKAVEDGRISADANMMIDPEVADVEWVNNTAAPGPRRAKVWATPATAVLELGRLPAAGRAKRNGKQSPPSSQESDIPTAIPIFNDERARHEKAKADLAEMKVEAQRAGLVPLDDVKAKWFGLLRQHRDRLLGISDRIAEELAAATSHREAARLVHAEITEALTMLEAPP